MKDEAKANFFFYDANAKFSHKFDDRNRLYLGVYNGWDKLTVDDLYDEGSGSEGTFSKSADKYRIGWGNTIAAMRLILQTKPENSAMEPIIVPEVVILGKVVSLLRRM